MRRTVLPILALGAAAIGCEPYTKPFTPADRAIVRASLDTFTARVLRADWPAAAKLYAPGARFMPPNQKVVVGPQNIETWMRSFPPLKAFALTIDTIAGSGDIAYVAGHYTMTFTPPGAPAPVSDAGKFLEVPPRGDGAWLNIADEFNSDQPPAPPAPAPKPTATRRRGR